jgi:coiled-coil domain-containing protein 12
MDVTAVERKRRLAALRGQVNSDEDKDITRIEQTTQPGGETLEGQANSLLEQAKTLGEEEGPLSLSDLAPKQANADLKRDLQKKMEPLEEKTQHAMRDYVRHRLQQQQQQQQQEE